jgi:glycosyltransferase involved in cell wall biosynthesis
MNRKTVCLNMIVKDEAHLIRRCLESALPLIDSWVIVDTGSSDGTQDVIREFLKEVPGELFERPWRDFAYNRTEAIELARNRGDYLLFIDADDVFELPAGFRMPELDADAYDMTIDYAGMSYRRATLVRAALPWRWEGVVHEYLECGSPYRRKALDGGRSRVSESQKYRRDAEVLERALLAEPQNARYVFYLAQSYRDCGEPEQSLAAYRRRAAMGGFDEEVFCALLESARLLRCMGRDAAEVTQAFLKAYNHRPSRAEPLGELALYYRENGAQWPLCLLFAEKAMQIPMPDDVLFVGRDWYEWRCRDEYSIAAYWMGEYDKSRLACEQLLGGGKLPAEQRPRVLENLRFAKEKLGLPT